MTSNPKRHALDAISRSAADVADLAGNPGVANPARNVALLCTSLPFLDGEAKIRANSPRPGPHSLQDLDVNAEMASAAGFFDWFSVGMLHLILGVSMVATLAGQPEVRVTLCARPSRMKPVRKQLRRHAPPVPEASPLRS